jgi:hypothetical protein
MKTIISLCTLGLMTASAIATQPQEAGQDKAQKAPPAPKVSPDWLRLDKSREVWLDSKGQRIIVGGTICLREGQLEMFACPKGTKEHESVVSVNAPAHTVHAGLLALGAKEGQPVRFQPQYRPASGVVVDIQCVWIDDAGQQQATKAQQWVKRVKTGKALQYDWVFAGSGFWVDGEQRYYYGDAGEFICVSNFPTATLDLPIESTQANEELLFAAFTENIPPLGTPVQLILKPRLDSKKDQPAGAEGEAKQPKAGEESTGKKASGDKADQEDAGVQKAKRQRRLTGLTWPRVPRWPGSFWCGPDFFPRR